MRSVRLRDLKAKVQAAKEAAGAHGKPMCERCRCPKHVVRTSEEKRKRVRELLARAHARMLAADPELPVRELREQISQPGFAELLARVGFRLEAIPNAGGVAEEQA